MCGSDRRSIRTGVLPEGIGAGLVPAACAVGGTGKTMAAEVLANDLRLDLYRIERRGREQIHRRNRKNLPPWFAAVRAVGILLPTRLMRCSASAVNKDSHDRGQHWKSAICCSEWKRSKDFRSSRPI